MPDDPPRDDLIRCPWVEGASELVPYHDDEWGFPQGEDVRLFEKMSLESFQAGLSWRTIYNKRPNFRRAFKDFVPARVARFGPRDVERLLGDAGIVRHRGKIEAVIHNAGLVAQIAADHGSLAAFVWQYEPDPSARPEQLLWGSLPSESAESKALSKQLKRYGWRFFGPTTAYAFMQSEGLVNDHVEGCEIRARVEAARGAFERPS
ncbi:MAG TPA: DNA-3-methyladenine glycosylase I [Planctomycetes bacterium]|nr:DNA-3-methyladenine glycosylase I [Planctomycetota bacterium]